jgi:hypothetical protein
MTSVDDLMTWIDRLNELLRERRFGEIDSIFRQIDLAKLSPEEMLAFVLTTFAARLKLAEWNSLRDRIRIELSSRYYDANAILRGLY